MLSSPPTEEEIKDAVLLQILIALQDLMDFLAPSTAWGIIQNDWIAAVLYFFHGGIIPRSINATAIALIPKKESPATFFRFQANQSL